MPLTFRTWVSLSETDTSTLSRISRVSGRLVYVNRPTSVALGQVPKLQSTQRAVPAFATCPRFPTGYMKNENALVHVTFGFDLFDLATFACPQTGTRTKGSNDGEWNSINRLRQSRGLFGWHG